MPDCAIFADTQGEPQAVYDHLAWLRSADVLPFPVHVVSKGPLWEAATTVKSRKDGKASYISTGIPVHLTDGISRGIGMRQCTRDFKISPIITKVRDLLGRRSIRASEGEIVEMWIGISTDEAVRMKPSRQPWIRTRWPLIEKRMSRFDCLNWMTKRGYPTPPKSSCTFCPYHDDAAWLRLTPSEFEDAVAKEREIQEAYAKASKMRSVPYFHASRVPLSEVVFDADNRKQAGQLDLFNNECEGMCGV